MVFATIVLVAAETFMLIAPSIRGLVGLKQKQAEMGLEINLTQDRLNYLTEVSQNQAELEKLYEDLLVWLPESIEQNDFILQWKETAKASLLNVASVIISKSAAAQTQISAPESDSTTPGQTQNSNIISTQVASTSIQFESQIEGTFQALLNFIANLRNLKRIIILNDISIRPSEGINQYTIAGQAYYSPINPVIKSAHQRLVEDIDDLKNLIRPGIPVKAEETPGQSPEPFGTL